MRNPQPKEWCSEDYSQQRIADYKPFNFVDGEGVRNSLYVSGCLFACEGCFNKAVQNFRYGTPYTLELENQIIADLSHDYVQGLTLLGVTVTNLDPLTYENIVLPLWGTGDPYEKSKH
jgi:anaerobic ribonucleoside-triphosphate reductase activating protein